MELLEGLNVKCLQSWLEQSMCWINYHHHWYEWTTLREPGLLKEHTWQGMTYVGPNPIITSSFPAILLVLRPWCNFLLFCMSYGTLALFTTFQSVPLPIVVQVTVYDPVSTHSTWSLYTEPAPRAPPHLHSCSLLQLCHPPWPRSLQGAVSGSRALPQVLLRLVWPLPWHKQGVEKHIQS